MQKSLIKFWKKCQYQFRSSANFLGRVSRSQDGSVRQSFRLRVLARFLVMSALSCVLYFIAGNIGSGWLYLICACLMGTLFIACVCPLLQLMCVHASQKVSPAFYAGQSCDVTIYLDNLLLNKFSKFLSPFVQNFCVRYVFSGEQPAQDTPVIVERLEAQKTLIWKTSALRRGVYDRGKILIESCFPMGMLWWQKIVWTAGHEKITVYPKVLPIEGFFLYKLPPAAFACAAMVSVNQSARQSTQTRSVREYVRGDSPRIIHWASSARTGRLLVREFEAEGLPVFDVLIDLTKFCRGGKNSAAAFELAVCAAASLLNLGHRLGIGPKLLLNPDLSVIIDKLDLPPTAPGMQEQMEILARIQPDLVYDCAPALRRSNAAQKAVVEIGLHGVAPDPMATYVIEVLAERDQHSGQIDDDNATMPNSKSIISSEDDIASL